MSYTRPTGAGWHEGQPGDPVEVLTDPPGDGIGPDLTPPDRIDGQDRGEFRRLERDHRAAVKDAAGTYTEDATPELFETAEVEPIPSPFPAAPTPDEDPREEKPAAKDPREGDRKS